MSIYTYVRSEKKNISGTIRVGNPDLFEIREDVLDLLIEDTYIKSKNK